ncbi:MAG: hypothetical protein GX549_04675 [Clostridiales bacterium]|nr:hypothetical protein [Clostridiales bacterium]
METVRNNESGEVIFQPVRISREGTFLFKIREVKGANSSIVYDEEPIAVRVVARESGGTLSATVTYSKGGTPVANPAFVNKKTAPETGDAYLTYVLYLLAASALFGGGFLVIHRQRNSRREQQQ